MTETDRTRLLTVVAKLSERYPEWRLGQLIANVAGWADRDVWDIDDQEWLGAAEAHLNPPSAPTREFRRERCRVHEALRNARVKALTLA